MQLGRGRGDATGGEMVALVSVVLSSPPQSIRGTQSDLPPGGESQGRRPGAEADVRASGGPEKSL